MNTKELKKLVKREKVKFHQEGKNPKLIILGEEHTESYLSLQEKIIEMVKPEIVLHEGAQKEFLKIKFPLNPGSRIRTKRIFNWEKKYNLRILSLDLPYKNSKKKDFKDLEKAINKLKGEYGIVKEKSRSLSLTRISNAIREEIMVKNIKKAIKKTKKQLLVVVGCAHSSPYSVLIKRLKKEKIDFINIQQSPSMIKVLNKISDYFR